MIVEVGDVSVNEVAERRVCSTCKGGGVVHEPVAGPDVFGNVDVDEFDCEDCGGSGVEPAD